MPLHQSVHIRPDGVVALYCDEGFVEIGYGEVKLSSNWEKFRDDRGGLHIPGNTQRLNIDSAVGNSKFVPLADRITSWPLGIIYMTHECGEYPCSHNKSTVRFLIPTIRSTTDE